MEAMLFSQRLTRLLTGDPEEGTLPDGAKLHIQNLQNEYFDSVLRDFETSYRNTDSLWQGLEWEEYEIMNKIYSKTHKRIIDVIRESENAIDTFFVNSIQNINESSSQQLCHTLQGLETKFSDIKPEILQLEANQWYRTAISNSISIKALVSNSYSSSGAVKKRERQIINKKPCMVGREDDMERLLDFLIEGKPSLSSIAIVGEPGCGKTTLAAQVYDNIYVKNYFDSRVWVKTSYEYDLKQLLEAILKSLMPSSGLQEIMEKEDEMKITTLRDYLRNKRYLIVLIDLGWPHRLDDVLPDDGNGSRVLATAKSYGDWGHTAFSLRRLNDTESLEMLTDGDFSNESSLLESETLKRSLKHICQGRPFAITLLRGMLSGKDKQDALPMLEYLCTRKDISYYYESIPDYLKPCFVYFAVFPESYDISTRQLYQLWIAEGFIEENSETTADMYLEELTMRGFIYVTSRSSTGRIKACRLHGSLAGLAVEEAESEWFISICNSEDGECFETCKRLSIRSEPNEFLSSEYSAQNLRSFLWLTSEVPNHAPIDCNHVFENSKLLKILDLGDLVFNHYPLGIENFVLLRYLKVNIPSLTSIPSSLCNLLNLYTLDMPSSHISEAPSDIWKMHKLRHLNFASIKLPAHPAKYCNSLENLNFISALCPSSCTEDILARLPDLLTLRIYGDLSSHRSLLSKSLAKLLCLESMKLVNESNTPELPSTVLSEYQFPPTLTQLSLSNTELKDDPMPILEKLPNLEVLKLKHNSYTGRTLACHSGGFAQLRVLHLKSLLWLEEWIMESGAMKKLECLLINPCAYLKRLPEELWHIKTFKQMELWSPRPELKPKLREVVDMERMLFCQKEADGGWKEPSLESGSDGQFIKDAVYEYFGGYLAILVLCALQG
ncbi:hypothetical protein LWI29_006163 [Acer saccharum]|uniref:NB-ARC domain-containing protein n=1 Tax=Acer saccharum TaxID=4024 RepID=A0AA39T071_ACESA|nr:hypothetical protein LWI29_006163 [Acer saccharum]